MISFIEILQCSVFSLYRLKEQMPKSNYSRYPSTIKEKGLIQFRHCHGPHYVFCLVLCLCSPFMLNKLVMSQDFNSALIYSTRLHFGSVVDTVSLNPIDVIFGAL